jgi:hypothetical protein
LLAAIAIIVKARRFDIRFDWFNRHFDIEKKSLQSIGLVAGCDCGGGVLDRSDRLPFYGLKYGCIVTGSDAYRSPNCGATDLASIRLISIDDELPECRSSLVLGPIIGPKSIRRESTKYLPPSQ